MFNFIYRTAAGADPGECLNLIPTKAGTMRIIEATKNAVIVQLMESWNEEGERILKRIVSIECVDKFLYQDLKDEALRILRLP